MTPTDKQLIKKVKDHFPKMDAVQRFGLITVLAKLSKPETRKLVTLLNELFN